MLDPAISAHDRTRTGAELLQRLCAVAFFHAYHHLTAMRALATIFPADGEPVLLPSMPQHSSTNYPMDHFTNITPQKADNSTIYEFSPEELVDKALKTLQDAGIQLIEWLSILHRRMGVPVIIKVSSPHSRFYFQTLTLVLSLAGFPLSRA